MKLKVWRVSTVEREFVNGKANYVARQRYVEAKSRKGAIGNAKNIWFLEPAEIRACVPVSDI